MKANYALNNVLIQNQYIAIVNLECKAEIYFDLTERILVGDWIALINLNVKSLK